MNLKKIVYSEKLFCHVIVYQVLSYFGVVWMGFICRKNGKTYENTINKPELMPSYTFSKVVQWAGQKSLLGHFSSPESYVI